MENKIGTAIRRDESLIDCEHAIIATLLNKPRLIGQAMASLDPEDFTGLRKPIFDAICRLYSTGKAVDTVVLTAQLGEEYRDYVYDIAKFPGNHAALEVYCEALRDGHRLEEAKEAATSVLYARSIAEASETIEKMAGLMSGRKRMRRLSAFDAASVFLDRLSDKRKKEFIQWGIDGLDINTYITKIKKLYDVSAVSIPANDGTSISARRTADGVIEQIKAERLERAKNKLKLLLEV